MEGSIVFSLCMLVIFIIVAAIIAKIYEIIKEFDYRFREIQNELKEINKKL